MNVRIHCSFMLENNLFPAYKDSTKYHVLLNYVSLENNVWAKCYNFKKCFLSILGWGELHTTFSPFSAGWKVKYKPHAAGLRGRWWINRYTCLMITASQDFLQQWSDFRSKLYRDIDLPLAECQHSGCLVAGVWECAAKNDRMCSLSTFELEKIMSVSKN